jgi:RNA polymerase sigma-54 factor
MLCPTCGTPLIEGVCLRCAMPSSNADQTSSADEDQIDEFLFVAAPRSLAEGLLADLYASLPEPEHPIAVTLVGSLDEHGFLVDDPADIAATLNVAPEQVERVLQHIRELGPVGIATRDTRTCMLAQLDLLAEQGIHCPHARTIVEQHLDELGAHRYRDIAHLLQVSTAEVEAAHSFIQQHLWPYPAQAERSSATQPDQTRYRMPDLSISEQEGKFVVEVLQSPRRMLRMNPLYQELARKSTSLDDGERTHVQEYVSRARVFLANLRQRESTLKRVGEAIVEHQHEALREGVRHLVPLTRAEIAAELGIHESTVSRAVTEKTALLPDRTLWPLSNFFESSRSIKDVLRELIEHETKPLSDRKLAQLLNERGYQVARRTVTKYREQMKILPSHLR